MLNQTDGIYYYIVRFLAQVGCGLQFLNLPKSESSKVDPRVHKFGMDLFIYRKKKDTVLQVIRQYVLVNFFLSSNILLDLLNPKLYKHPTDLKPAETLISPDTTA